MYAFLASRALRRFETLKDELEYIKTARQHVTTRKASITVDQEANAIGKGNGDTTAVTSPTQRHSLIASLSHAMTSPTHRHSLIAPLSRILPERVLKRIPEQRTQRMQYKNTNNLKVAFSELYLMLVLLQNYQVLNFTGFRKILKKHDKLFQTTRGEEWR
ncbi:unnamed protein product [Didymodactylos carnosus]|uniref:SPX domain-containing protein n=1 Tax=Didymodactylos carnosus TaxID=1234261 RepID=A0A815M714_9BILA|nr:unnamed protein product [Didymodactylos carnosus]CAF1497698.1 unnamed protein product [Didymodactylos carnosus]CAF4286559.1 unnamed protein product [Didymodactylos carnosus]CAF4303749.1 unnamed protein product [Didymodactylos carnosus]